MIIRYRRPTFISEDPVHTIALDRAEVHSPSVLLERALEVELITSDASRSGIWFIAADFELPAGQAGYLDDRWSTVPMPSCLCRGRRYCGSRSGSR